VLGDILARGPSTIACLRVALGSRGIATSIDELARLLIDLVADGVASRTRAVCPAGLFGRLAVPVYGLEGRARGVLLPVDRLVRGRGGRRELH
jgi:hypothetical protein